MNKSITYRPLSQHDTDNIFSLTSKESVARYMRFDTHTSREQATELLEEYLKNYHFAILISDVFAGIFVFKPDDCKGDQERSDTFSISIFLDEPYWNRGYSSLVLSDMKLYAKEHLIAKQLSAYVVDDNVGSKRVLEKNGFTIVKVLKFPEMECGLNVYNYTF